MLIPAVMLPTAVAQTPLVTEGKHFERLRHVQPIESGNKIEVLEFFSYACPHCWAFESDLQAWLMTMPADVQFRRVPVLFQKKWLGLVKIFYTLEALGAERRISPEVFVAIHRKKIDLTQEKVFFEWAVSNGLDRRNVEQAYGSVAVGEKVNQAESLAQAYGIDEIPVVIIDGKFVTEPHPGGSFGAMRGILDALVVKARAERPTTMRQ